MKVDKLALSKMAINFAAGAGVSKVVNDIIKNNTEVETVKDALEVAIGSLVLGSMAADAGSKHVNTKVDAIVAWWGQRKADKAESQ